MKYRNEIDGLRALAVIPVILFHAGFKTFNGGFVGVDIFFVISGYLITTIIIEDIEKNRFSIVKFYERRARRILPALFFVMLTCIIFAWIWMLPSQMKNFSQSIVSVSFFASNILFWHENGYFDSASEEKPLLHTWSLAVEEQYYVLFPILLLLAWRFGRNRVFWTIVVISVISLTLSEWGWRNNANTNFYLAPSRIWELLAGSIAAFFIKKRGVQASNPLSLLGLAAVLFSIFYYDQTTPSPSIYTLLPVTGVVLLILFSKEETITSKILSVKPLVGIGLISYSAYLWHQPLFAFSRIRLLNNPSQTLMTFLSIFSFIIAFISWKFIERPFRDPKSIITSRKFVFIYSAIGVLLLSTFGVIGHLTNGYKGRVSNIVAAIDNSRIEKNPYSPICHLGENKEALSHPIKGCTDFFVNKKSSVMLIGDSHLNSLGYQLQSLLKEKDIGSYSVSYSGCIPLAGFYRIDEDNSHKCDEYNRSMIKYARESGIKTLILVARFPLYLEGSRYDNGEGGVERGEPAPIDLIEHKGEHIAWESDIRKNRVAKRYKSSLEELLNEFTVIIVEPLPEAGWDVPEYFAFSIMHDVLAEPSVSLQNYSKRNARFFSVLDSINNDSLVRFDTSSVFCHEETQRCSLFDSQGSYYRDNNHLSSHGARILTHELVKRILPKIIQEQKD